MSITLSHSDLHACSGLERNPIVVCFINPTPLSMGDLLGELSGAVNPPTASGNLVGSHTLHSQRSHLSDEKRSSSVAGSFQTLALPSNQLLILSPRGKGDQFDQLVGHWEQKTCCKESNTIEWTPHHFIYEDNCSPHLHSPFLVLPKAEHMLEHHVFIAIERWRCLTVGSKTSISVH